MFVLRYSLRSVWWNVLTYSCKKKCIMSVYVFEWTRTVISQQYLDSMSLDSPADRNNVIKELALTAKVKVEWNNSGQVFLEGAWEHIMNVHIMLVKYVKLPGQVKDKDETENVASPPCSKPLLPIPVPSSPVPKTDTKTVLRYIRQKYLNASRRKNELHLQRSLSSQNQNTVPEVAQAAPAGDSIGEVKQENEVYVNITVSGNLDKVTGLLLPVCSTGQQSVLHLPYQVSASESDQVMHTDDLLVQPKGILINKCMLESGISSEHNVAINENNPEQTACHYDLSDTSVIATCRQSESVNVGQEFLDENICDLKNLMVDAVHDSTNVGRPVWHSDDRNSFQSHVTNTNESAKSSDSLYSLPCEPAYCSNGLKETGIQNGKTSCGKKKDYEKLAPFKFFCTLCSFKSKRESHYQRHLELHSKVSELFSCKKCDFTTIRLGHLRRHEMSHSDTKFTCDMCHYHTDHHKFLLRHQRIKHSGVQGRENVARKELLRCVECSYSTTRPFFYKRHLQSHTSANSSLLRYEHRFHCQQCSYKTSRKEHYIRHVNNVHNNKRPYLCDHCGKAFKRPDALKQHRVTHIELDSSLGAFRCPVCSKSCRAQAQLTQHLAVHSNVRSFLCEICGSAFKTRAVQRKHVLTIHKNPKAFSCSQCSRKFNTKYALRRHMKQHSLDKKRKVDDGADECAVEIPANRTLSLQIEPEENLHVLQSEPILIQETPRTQVHDSQTAVTVQVIGFMPYSDT